MGRGGGGVISIKLVDRFVVFVKIDKFFFLADFVIVGMDVDIETPSSGANPLWLLHESSLMFFKSLDSR